MKALIIDLDNTLCNIDHRLHHLRNGNKDWGQFFAGIPQDSVHWPVLDIISNFMEENWPTEPHKILLVSGRPEEHRDATVTWLLEHCALGAEWYSLYMRPTGDHRPDTEIKSEILNRILAEGYEISFVVDDRPSVCQMWRDRGIFVFQVNQDRWTGDTYPQGLLTLMVGPTGAGKSSFLSGDDIIINRESVSSYDFDLIPSKVISSDNIRIEICGNLLDQTKNTQVFSALHAIARARIQSGLDCCVDATNLRRRDRRAIIDACNASRVRYIVMNRSLEAKLATAGWRAGVPGLIEKHEQRFQSGLRDILSGDGMGYDVIDLRGENHE